ncbi:MAG: hypothetical protein IJ849_00900 [Selenomonadaceae bacterium]|nr:hypothetical protein [Selenomonadaceae bacterium]
MNLNKENKFVMARDGDSLRQWCANNNLFLYPYDIVTGADIALFKNEVNDGFIVMTMEEVKNLRGYSYRFLIKDPLLYASYKELMVSTPGVAVVQWNDRARKRAAALLQPLPRRFFSSEWPHMLSNFVIWGIVYWLVIHSPVYQYFFHDNLLFIIFLLLVFNVHKFFSKSYGAEIPRKILEQWLKRNDLKDAPQREAFYQAAMADWPLIRQRHRESLPLFLAWRRGCYAFAKEPETLDLRLLDYDKKPPAAAEPEPEEDYCAEIKEQLNKQLNHLKDERGKVADREVKTGLEDIIAILMEITHVIAATDDPKKILPVRKIVSYWNEEVISLLNTYLLLAQNTSGEAKNTKKNIAAVLQEVYPVYKNELEKITEGSTLETKASIAVIRQEIQREMKLWQKA